MAKLKMQVKKWLSLFEGLKALDGYKEGDKTIRYVFSEPTQLKISRNMIRIEKAMDEYEKSRVSLVKSMGVEGLNVADPSNTPEQREKLTKYVEAVNALHQEEVEITMMELTIKELCLEKNNIPRVVLAVIEQVIPELSDDQES